MAKALVLDELLRALHEAARYNKDELEAPIAILWTDKAKAWAEVLPRLRSQLPVLTLGDYDPASTTGPGIWLRCVLAGLIDLDLPQGTPILYLPGVSRQDLRAVEDCPESLKPLVEYQYRGVFFTQANARDWTPTAFLQNRLGAKVAEDTVTKEALLRALPALMDERAEFKDHGPLTAAYFNALLLPDPIKGMLAWLNDAEAERTRLMSSGALWETFCATAKKEFKLDPEKDGVVTAAQRLGLRTGKWADVWTRFKEAPSRYPKLEAVLRRAKPVQSSVFDSSETWPQDNEDEEQRLAEALTKLPKLSLDKARGAVDKLEVEHGHRRDWVWAELGQASLALALPDILALATRSAQPLGTGTPQELAERYQSKGYQVDALALKLMGWGKTSEQTTALHAVLDSLYKPWLEEAAKTFQQAVKTHGWTNPQSLALPQKAEVQLFCDGLRFDVAMGLKEKLELEGLNVEVARRMGALPGVTSSAKPAVSPVGSSLVAGSNFDVLQGGTKVTINVLRRLLEAQGVQVLQGRDTGRADGSAWTEHGDLDNLGHNQGWKLSQRMDSELQSLYERIAELLQAGWQKVRVLTDHGWLLLPSKLDKVDLPQHLTDYRKGRCARLKPDAQTGYQRLAWHYDETVDVAFAPGICAFEAGKDYDHGGLSPQECVLPLLTVTQGAAVVGLRACQLSELSWVGLRCRLKVEAAPIGAWADLRTKANDGSSSVLASPKMLSAEGHCSLVVADDHYEGSAVHLVIIDTAGNVLTQQTTTVGGEC